MSTDTSVLGPMYSGKGRLRGYAEDHHSYSYGLSSKLLLAAVKAGAATFL